MCSKEHAEHSGALTWRSLLKTNSAAEESQTKPLEWCSKYRHAQSMLRKESAVNAQQGYCSATTSGHTSIWF